MTNLQMVKKFTMDSTGKNARLLVRQNGDKMELIDYNTVIAYKEIGSNTIYLNTQYYSQSTSTIQNMVRKEGGIIREYNNEEPFRKLPYRHEVAFTR